MPIIVTSVAVTGYGPEPDISLPTPTSMAPNGATAEDAIIQRGALYLDHAQHDDVGFYDRDGSRPDTRSPDRR